MATQTETSGQTGQQGNCQRCLQARELGVEEDHNIHILDDREVTGEWLWEKANS